MDRRTFLATLLAPYLMRMRGFLPKKADPRIDYDYMEWYFESLPRFQFGFSGFKGVASNVDTWKSLYGTSIIVKNPRSGFKLEKSLGGSVSDKPLAFEASFGGLIPSPPASSSGVAKCSRHPALTRTCAG